MDVRYFCNYMGIVCNCCSVFRVWEMSTISTSHLIGIGDHQPSSAMPTHCPPAMLVEDAKPAFKTNSDKSAVVDPTRHYMPIDKDTPRGSKVLMINRSARVATIGSIGTHETFFTHWAPLPTFED
jgi:hypothetical protein